MRNYLLLLITVSITLFASASIVNAPANAQYGFIENKGQIVDQNHKLNSEVLYLYSGSNIRVQLRKSGFSYELFSFDKGSPKTLISPFSLPHDKDTFPSIQKMHRLDFTFLNSSENCKIIADDAAPDCINYYIAETPLEGVTNVHHYFKITYKNIYPNVDIEFVINAKKNFGGFKYNYIIHPGGNIDEIRFRIDGAVSSTLTPEGNILIATSLTALEEKIPFASQDNNPKISTKFKQWGQDIFGVWVSHFDETIPLKVDPLPWLTYYGGNASESGTGIGRDANNNIIVYGTAYSTNNIASSGAFQTTSNGYPDLFIVKFNASGSRIWGTYYGGTSSERSSRLTIDSGTNIIVTGSTFSYNGIATPGSFRPTKGPFGNAALIAKFNGLGYRQWGTYFGASKGDWGIAITTDFNHNIYLAGYTEGSDSGIATPGAFSSTYTHVPPFPTDEGFLAKFNSSGSIRYWGTYVGGSNFDHGSGVKTDASGNVFYVGDVGPGASIASSNGYQTTYSGGIDGCIIKFDSLGNHIWGSFLGGSSYDHASAISIDASGNFYVLARTTSSGLAASGTHQANLSGATDAYLIKFNASFGFQKATYLGGTGTESPSDLITDAVGNVYILGRSDSTNGIASPGAYQTSNQGGINDIFLIKFNSNFIRQWGTFYGGTGEESASALTFDSAGNAIFVGQTSSVTGMGTAGGFQSIYGGGTYNAIVGGFTPSGSLPVRLTYFGAELFSDNNSKRVLCSWITAEEVNNDYFIIERSEDGVNFSDIGKIKGSGNSKTVHRYSYNDNLNNTLQNSSYQLFYRLKQVDFDGAFTFSEIITVNSNEALENSVITISNPFNDFPTIWFNEINRDCHFSIKVMDLTGKKIIEKHELVEVANPIIQMHEMSKLLSGIYIVEISSVDGFYFIQKVIKSE